MQDRKKEEQRRHVAETLRRIRGAQSQEEFAARIGATQSQVSEWEAGKCSPSMASLVRLCQVTGTDLSEFVPALRKKRSVS